MKATRLRLEVDERREKLIELGAELFGKHPYDELSIELIANKAGISKGLIYHYFSTKKDFYVEVVRHTSKRFIDATNFGEEIPAFERLCRTLEAFLRFADENREAFQALYLGGMGMDPAARKVLDEVRGITASRLARGMEIERPSALENNLLHSAVGFIESSTLHWLRHRDVPPEKLVEAISTAVVALLSAARY